MTKTLGDITEELTKKVLDPAKTEAAAIVKSAEGQSAKIIADAQAQAERVVEAARLEAERLKKQMETDLETACRNFLLMIEERLEKAVVDPVVEENLKPPLADKEFLEKMILEVLAGYVQRGGKENRIELLLPEDKKEELEKWFLEKFRGKMKRPLDVRFSDKISFGFKLGDASEGSHVNFSEGLVHVFSQFCSPRFRKYFFIRKES